MNKKPLALIALGLPLMAASAPKKQPDITAEITLPSQPPKAREFRPANDQTMLVQTRVRFDTMIFLPPGDPVVFSGVGDSQGWQMEPATLAKQTNIWHVKPAFEGQTSNLHLVTKKGRAYSFVLVSLPKNSTQYPDITVLVHPEEFGMEAEQPAPDRQKEIDALTGQLAAARAETLKAGTEAEARAAREVSEFRSKFPLSIQAFYKYDRNRKPFYIQDVFTDGTKTYVLTTATDLPAPTLQKDGKDAIAQYSFVRSPSGKSGMYVIDSVPDSGSFRLGRKTTKFLRPAESEGQ